MRFICQITESNGIWKAEHSSPDIGPIRVSGATRDEALKKMEGEIRYWVEMCPCTGNALRDLQIELVESK
jgi:hypothetical protein